MSNISRRDALRGATAAAITTGAITAPLAMQAAGVQAALAGDPAIILPVDPVLLLKRQWDARWAPYASETNEDEDVIDALHDRLSETAFQIFQTPAATIEGVTFKLVLWARQHVFQRYAVDGDWAESDNWSRLPVTAYRSLDLDHLPVVSALHDLERMAGRAML